MASTKNGAACGPGVKPELRTYIPAIPTAPPPPPPPPPAAMTTGYGYVQTTTAPGAYVYYPYGGPCSGPVQQVHPAPLTTTTTYLHPVPAYHHPQPQQQQQQQQYTWTVPPSSSNSRPYFGATRAQIEADDAAIAQAKAAKEAEKARASGGGGGPQDKSPGKMYYCRELDGGFSVRNYWDCMRNCQPGAWEKGENGAWWFVRS